MTASAILDGLAQAAPMLLSLFPGGALVAPWVSAGLGLASRAARAGLSPEAITRIDLASLGARRAEADARLDALLRERDAADAATAQPVRVARHITGPHPDIQTVDVVPVLPGSVDPPNTQPGAPAFEYPDDPEPGGQKREAEAALNEVRAVLRAGHTSADDLRSDIEAALGGLYPDDLPPGEQGPGTVLP